METISKATRIIKSDQLSTERRLATLNAVIAERPLLFILAAAFVLRALAAVYFSGAIDTEGAEYAGIAKNLLSGNGYVGIATPGAQLFFPPLFPFAIAVVSLLTGDAEIAGRIISVTLGALIVLPTYFIAFKMYSRRVAALAATLVGCHPFLIYMSTTVFCEMTYLTLVLSAICLTMSTLENTTLRNLFFSGMMYGLAYLVRPETAAYMLISATFIFVNMLIKQRADVLFTFARVSLMALSFSLVAAPYVAWLSTETGQFRIEGKSPLNMEIVRRMQLGQSLDEALFSVDSFGNESGVGNQPNLVIDRTHSLSLKDFLTYIRLKTKSVIKNASEMLTNFGGFGLPPLFALAVIGLFARPWPAQLAIYQLQIVSFLALVIFGTYFVPYSGPRFYVLFVPFYCIWASAGVQKIVSWGIATASAMGLPRRHGYGLSLGIAALVSCLVPSLGYAGTLLADQRASRVIKMTGEWLHANMTGPIRMLDSTGVLAFHANASSALWLPYCDEKTALEYIEMNKINVVVVRKSDADSRPYLKSWADNGIPDIRAQLVKVVDGGTQGSIMIYEIRR